MQVYVVTAGFFYESDDHCSLWDCKSAADARADQLREEYDWAEVNLHTVHMGSAIDGGNLNTKDGITTPW